MKDAQQKLFEWREKFFREKFKSYVACGDDTNTWITDGGDDAHGFDTIPYQIASNFDKVLKLASTKRILGPKEYFFFEHDEIKSSQAQRCFDAGFRRMLEEDGDIGSSEDEESPLHCRAPEIPVGLVRMTSTSGRLGDIN